MRCVIDLDKIAFNTRQAAARVNSLMAVVKADGYGHGALPVAKTMLQNGASSLAVAICEEAVQLWDAGIDAPILVLGYTPAPLMPEVIRRGITQTVFHEAQARELSDAAVRLGKTVSVHIKIDTGMSRLGFMPNEEGVRKILEVMSLPNLRTDGIYTHFATSDEPASPFVYTQLERFRLVLGLLENFNVNLSKITVHIANSGAIINNSDVVFPVSRAGILLYGLPPANFAKVPFELRPAMSLVTKISYIKQLPEGVGVSYAQTYVTKNPSVVATIPVGYADGYPRNLSNRGKVIIGGEFAPIIGNICMDQLMVDVTDISKKVTLHAGDDVILMGGAGGVSVTADDIADTVNTINYEIVCNIGKRVPRFYKGGA
ncbi:alanine racemase 1 [Clostridia bacterium]|nr:alanine racemase 1 [Clostridia bacterium]